LDRDTFAELPGDRFRALWKALGACGRGDDVLERLAAAYAEPHRAYHTARHVAACLALLDQADVRALAERPSEVEAALWLHDAVYDTHAHDNEARSAALAGEVLRAAGVGDAVVDRIAAHVRATQSHVSDSADGRLVIDIDLSILGADDATYDAFEAQIRREYAWVEPAAYAAGRAGVLRRFLDRTTIYATPLLRDRLEARARANLARAIAAL
jgi:predicted metal-dependent HD superfamily phosphohydrolase